eukprot:362446-Chlamydomonas_euryale.AAC.5
MNGLGGLPMGSPLNGLGGLPRGAPTGPQASGSYIVQSGNPKCKMRNSTGRMRSVPWHQLRGTLNL